ncbi:hypothetical protein NHX12_021775 [Muraenolepis orangiensis]|uniref:F-box domain-containing protein n=1 Tax=Muraenolepis orangiensis TaxID=630683 RepID=A0A9Q0EU45_9TELE|nr:hypothetical protein NHX12_021775 [Muraenolepis orangiensis]
MYPSAPPPERHTETPPPQLDLTKQRGLALARYRRGRPNALQGISMETRHGEVVRRCSDQIALRRGSSSAHGGDAFNPPAHQNLCSPLSPPASRHRHGIQPRPPPHPRTVRFPVIRRCDSNELHWVCWSAPPPPPSVYTGAEKRPPGRPISTTRTLSTPSPGLILPSKSSSLSSPALSSNSHDTHSSSSSSAPAETSAEVHAQHAARPPKGPRSSSPSPVELLPDHALLQVFARLPTNQLCRCARVSRRWYNLAWDPRLWASIRLTGELLHADRALRILTRRLCQDTPNVCLTLETVVVSGCKRLTDRGLYVLAQCCPELRRLEVAGCYNVSNEAVFEVVSRCPNLEHLNLAGCSKVTCISLTEEASLQLAPAHGQQISISFLDMSDCLSLEDEGLRIIASHCPRLTHLYLRRCPRLTDEALRHLALHCPSVRELSLSDCRLLGDFGLREVARLEGRLRYLSVAHCPRITDVGVRYVARYCPRLRYLNARGCEGLTDHGLGHLARSCPRLRSLDVGKCPLVSDGGLERLALCCAGLRRLSLRACESVSGRGLRAVAANCGELQLLNVQDCEVSPEALRYVRRHCRRCVIEHTNPAFY